MFMVKHIFHQTAHRLPVGVFLSQPTFLAGDLPNTADLKQLLFSACPSCLRSSSMCSIPQAVFATRQIRLNEDRCVAVKAETESNRSSKGVFDNQALEQPPLKYNSKLMNSIWGLYNRYSVHNFKKNTDDYVVMDSSKQQCQALNDTAAQPTPGQAQLSSAGNVGLGGASGNSPPIGGAINSCRNLFVVALRAI